MKRYAMDLKFKLTLEEVNQILEALGTQPYNRVFQLINKLHIQADEQMKSKEAAESPKLNNDSPLSPS